MEAVGAADSGTVRRPAGTSRLFVVYVAAFHLLWVAWPFLVYPRLTALGERTLRYALLNLALRLLIWVAPVVAYLRWVDRVNPLHYLRLRGRVGRGLAVAAALTLVNVAGMLLRFGPPHASLDRVTWNSVLGTSFLVGFIEEVPYRGFMLQKLGERVGFWRANLATSLLFLSIHLPGWIALGLLHAAPAIFVLVFSLIMGVAFRYAGSLWAPIVAHSANDCLSFVVFRL